jgi:carbon-monoxide dehydrogenase large subunit
MATVRAPKTSGIGASVRRTEDTRLVTGSGSFTDDRILPGAAHAATVRSPHAHARILSIDVEAARRAPGVLAVLTAADLEAAGVKPIPSLSRAPGVAFKNRDGSEMADPPYYPLAREKVRFAGEVVAFVVAETRAQALDAAEMVAVEFEPLGSVTDPEAALAEDAAQIWDEYPGNLGFDWEQGDAAKIDEIFRSAAHVTKLKLVNNRIVVNYLEPRSASALFDPVSGAYTLYSGSQSAHRHKNMLANGLGVPPENVRVISGDVGGAFGARTFFYPEYLLVAFAAKLVGRPVKWRADRSDAFLSDLQGRGQVAEASLALDKDGRFLAIRAEVAANVGGYLASLAPFVIIVNQSRMTANVYAVPQSYLRIRGVFTNYAPVGAYRGVGRAESIYIFERLIDAAAREMKIDRIELRRRNFIPPSAMPYTTPTGAIYDSGEFEEIMNLVLDAADWSGFARRKSESRMRGKLRGIGLACYIEGAGGLPLEYGKVRLEEDGTITALAGSQSNGQGHETTYAQVVAERLGLPFEQIRVRYGDTGIVEKGHGTFASRSMRMAGSALHEASNGLIERAKGLAAHEMNEDRANIEFSDGLFRVKGTNRTMTWADLAQAAGKAGLPEELRGEMSSALEYQSAGITYPNGCHVCELEVDPDTGDVAVVRYTVVDDVGRVINPMIVHGQVQGGVAQGIGQALFERVHYDKESGQLLTGSFVDYRIARAGDLPQIVSKSHEVLCANNPIGVKGAGEGGATGAPPAVINALLHALADVGVQHIDMPATPEVVWQAIRDAATSGKIRA